MACDNCPLNGRTKVPFTRPKSTSNSIMIIGESPGYNEVIEGKPFVGRSGKLLNECLAIVGINREECSIANSAKCRMTREFKKSAKDVNNTCKCCREFLISEIVAVRPKFILVLGSIALKQVLKQAKISSAHGVIQWSSEFDCWAMASYHPSYCLQFPQYKQVLIEDLTKMVRFINNNYSMDSGKIQIKRACCIDDAPGIREAKYIAIDSETQGLDPFDPNGLVISFSFCFDKNIAYQVILHEEVRSADDHYDFTIQWPRKVGKSREIINIPVRRSDRFEEKLELLRFIMESEAHKFMFNGNFDIMFFNYTFKRYGYDPPELRNYLMDVQAAAQLLEENVYSRCSLEQARKGLTTIVSDYSTKFDSVQDKSDMLSANPEELEFYAGMDALVTYHCGMAIRHRLNNGEEYVNPFVGDKPLKQPLVEYLLKFTMPVLAALRVLEENGALVLVDKIESTRELINIEAMNAARKAIELIPEPIKLKHEKKGIRLSRLDLIRDTLFSSYGFGIESVSFTNTGSESIDAKTRKAILQNATDQRVIQFLQYYEMWSEYSGLINKYIKQFEENIKPDNRIHPRYSVATTVTGRTSASNPSIQNFPKRSSSSKIIRSLITAPPGHVLLSFDQAQAELRWAAQLSGDKNMISAYLEGSDLHTKTAEALLGKSKSEVDPEEFKKFRRSAKVVNFGLLYGMGSYKFRDYAQFEYGLELSLDEAQRYRDVFFSTYPGLLSYHKAVERFCKKFKYIVSPLGRVRRFPEIDGDDEEIVKRAIRQAINFPIQSASSDSVLLSLVLLLRKKVLDKRLIRPIIFIHDDLTFECVDKPDIISYYVSEIKKAMENPPLEDFGIKMLLPLRSDVEIGYTLAEMKEYNG